MRAVEAKAADVVGRADELALLRPFLDAVANGPAALVFEGEAGIGKTRLWMAGVAFGREHGYEVLSCRPAEAEMQLPFVALGDLLGDIPEHALAPLPEPQRRALDVAMLRADSEGTAIERRAVSLAVLGVLQRLAHEAPVLLALDDLQWIDAPSEEALRFALRRLDAERIGLLGTRRGRAGPLALVDALPTERVRRVAVAGLDVESLGRLLLRRLGLALAQPALLQLHRVSAGNPFLALEIARALERREVTLVPGRPFPVPHGLRELVRDRLEHLARAARDTGVLVAALAQPTFERVEAAAAAAGLGAEGLSQAVAAGIVEVDDERVRFTHPLLGSIIYSEASPARRRALHARLALATDEVEERARHLALAATGPDANVAAALDEAALKAFRRGAPEAAADLYEQAVRLTPAGDQRLGYQRLIEAGRARARAGDGRAARRAFEAAAEEAPERPARAHALTELASILIWDSHAGLSASLESYERARAEADGDPALTCAIEHDLAWLFLRRGERILACSHARRAIELAGELGDDERLARALLACALMEAHGSNEEALVLLGQAFRLEESVSHRPFGDRPQFLQALLLAGDGRLDEARAITLGEYRRALDHGDEGSLPTVLEHLTIIERRAGNWEDAERYAREMHEKTERSHFSPDYHSGPYAWILALRGRVDEARALAEKGLVLADAAGIGPTFGGHRAVLGVIALSSGDARACAEVLEPLSSTLTPEIAETGWFRFLADEIEARLELGDLERAGAVLGRLSERRGVLLDRAWARAAAERCQALVLASAGDEAAANDAFVRAHREHERVHEPFELARTLLAQGRVERRFKHRRASREHLTAARDLFERLGSPLWVARTDDELRRIGGRAPRAAGLTSTEERVAELAADGLTNREIAARLFLSVNTVQAYLKRIYRELDVRSRTELARAIQPVRVDKEH
jgi:DNA-binding CsgD family transcriptional regulator